jgi:hypothetical protein
MLTMAVVHPACRDHRIHIEHRKRGEDRGGGEGGKMKKVREGRREGEEG